MRGSNLNAIASSYRHTLVEERREAGLPMTMLERETTKLQRHLAIALGAAAYSSVPGAEHFASSNRETAVIVHIEGVEGVTNLSEILTVKGLDVIFLGPYDLSQSCGVPGQVEDGNDLGEDLDRMPGQPVRDAGDSSAQQSAR